MSRAPRVDIADLTYHVINRANGRQTIFDSSDDYRHFEKLLKDAIEKYDMRLIAYVLMPNHWHLILHPKADGDISRFMQWLTLTHTQQMHVKRKTIGYGHIYQGRYKSFLIEKESYLVAAIKYVERNPVRARLAKVVEGWRWGSGYRRILGTITEKKLVSDAPVALPKNYRSWVNVPDKTDDLADLRVSVNKGRPFGRMGWVERTVKRFGLELTTRAPGRPKKGT